MNRTKIAFIFALGFISGCISFLTGILILAPAEKTARSTDEPYPFTTTNFTSAGTNFTNASIERVFLLTNGIHFGFRSNSLSVDIPGSYALWLYYDPATTKPRKMIHQFYGDHRYWLTDRDADGMPDTRDNWIKKEQSILVDGQWITAKLLGTNATTFDGGPRKFTFTNGKWQPKQ